jgi:hypothetical protein
VSKRRLQRTSNPASIKEQQETAKPSSGDEGSAALVEKEVDARMAKAVINALGHFGPPAVVDSLLYILELEHSVDVNSVTNNLPALRLAFSKMFAGAAYVIEGKLVDSLGKQLGIDSEGKTLETMIDLLRARIKETATAAPIAK